MIAGDINPAAVGSELDGVGDEIEQNLLESLGVGCHMNFMLALWHCESQSVRFCLQRT